MRTDQETARLASAAARHLPGFTVTTRDDGMSEASIILAHPDGRALDIYPITGTARAAVRGIYPPTRMDIRSWPEITVAIARGPRALAAEITRRLLPGYTSTYHQLTRHNEADHADQQAREAAAQLLAGQLPGAAISRADPDGITTVRWAGTSSQGGAIRLSGDGRTASLNLRDIPLAAAVRIAGTLATSQAAPASTADDS